MIYARQSTAVVVTVGPVLDADGVAVTGGVVGDFKIAKNGGAPAALNGSATLTHRHTGFYSLSLTTSDVDTVGTAEVTIDDTVNACPMKEIQVIEEAVYDALFAASANAFAGAAGSSTVTFSNTSIATVTTATNVTTVNGLAANVITATSIAADAITDAKVASDVTIASVTGAVGSVTGNVGGNVSGNVGGNVTGSVGSVAAGGITAGSFAAGAIDAAAIAANAIGASELAADAVAEIADAVWDEATSGHVTSGTFGQALFPIRAGTAQAGANGSITLDASASAVDDFYKNSLVVVTGGTGANQVRTISGYTGSTKVATITPNWGTNPSSDSVFVILPNGAIAGASAPTAGEVADAVWDEARSGHVSAGTFGEYVLADAVAISGDTTAANNAESFFDGTGYAGTNNVIPTVTTVGTVNALAANSVNAIALAADAVTEIWAGSTAPSAATIADSVWDEDATAHQTQGTFGQAIGDPGADSDTIWGLANTNLDAAVSSRMATYTQPTGFLAATFPTTVASTTNITAGTITTVTNLTNAPTAGDLTATMKTSVNTEVLDVLNTDTFAEPGQGTPAATATLAAKINYLYKAWRNKKTQTSTTLNLFADDTTTVDQKATVSDDGTTTTVGEIATGP